MLDYYSKSKPENQWTAVYETRTYGGVRGAPRCIVAGCGLIAHGRLLD